MPALAVDNPLTPTGVTGRPPSAAAPGIGSSDTSALLDRLEGSASIRSAAGSGSLTGIGTDQKGGGGAGSLMPGSFASLLEDRQSVGGDEADERAAQQEQARRAAEELVAFGFVLPMMKQARDSAFKSDLMHGKGEDAFAGQLDQHLARSIVRRMDTSLVDAVERRMTGRGQEVDRHG